jgi:hypothetical protein
MPAGAPTSSIPGWAYVLSTLQVQMGSCVRGRVRNNIKNIDVVYLNSLSFWDNRLFDMISEPL